MICKNQTNNKPNQTNKHINSPSTSRSTILTQPTPTKLTTHQRRTRITNHLGTILALIHLVTGTAVEGVAAVADADFVIGLEFVAPVTSCGDRSWREGVFLLEI